MMRDLPLAPDSSYRSACPGQTAFAGRYRLERLLARGEGDAEWLAKDKQTGNWVTLRFLPRSLGLDEEDAGELTRKARANWGLDHDSINRDLDFHQEGNLAALVSDYREGFTLARERMTRPARVFEPSDLEDWVKEVCAALDYARTQGGPPHGDLKPGALLQAKKGERVITRWGLAAELSQRCGPAAAQAGLAGTLAFSSPQRLAGEPASFSDDFYALGASLYELITGLPPFHEGDLEKQIRSDTPPSMGERRQEVGQEGGAISEGWETAVAACLAKDPGQRPSSGEEFLAYLDGSHASFVEAEPGPAHAAPSPKPKPSFEPASASPEDSAPPGTPRIRPMPAAVPNARAARRGANTEAGYTHPQEAADRESEREPKRLDVDKAPAQPFGDAVEEGGSPASRGLIGLAFVLLLVGVGAAYYFLAWLPGQDRRQDLSDSVEAESQQRAEEARIARESAAAENLQVEREATERVEAEWREAERLEAQRIEAERLEAERLEAERLEAQRVEAARREALRLEAERLAAERREAERREAERRELERQLQERETLAQVDSEMEESPTVAIEPAPVEASVGSARLVADTGAGQHPAAARLSLRSLELEADAPPIALEAEDVLEADRLPVGRYRATATREGWPPQTWEFELQANEAFERIFDLGGASVYLTSDPEGAEVWESEQKLGETPLLLEGLPPGLVEFEVRRRFHQSVTVSGEAVAGEQVALSAQLVAMEGPPDGVWEREAPGVGIPKVWIQPGSFVMGSPPDEEGRSEDEYPRLVTLSEGFWIGLHEVTQDEWQTVMGANPSLFKSGGGSLPVDTVSWSEAQEFCRRLNEQARREGRLVEGYEYRLPTEAEWEFASRAGREGRLADDELEAMAWYAENSGHRSRAVGIREPNAWGLFDMHGNLSEWCHDWYGPYPRRGETDPMGPASGSARVFRGGNWGSQAAFCRPAKRGHARPDDRFHFLGLRVVLAPIL